MSKHALANWLATKEKDYPTGVEIFIDLGIDVSKNKFFSTDKPSRIHKDMLFRKLSNFARIHGIKPLKQLIEPKTVKNVILPKPGINPANSSNNNSPGTKQGKTKVIIVNNPVVDFKELNDEMQQRWLSNAPIKGEMNTLHAELKQLMDTSSNDAKKRRGLIAMQLINLRKQYRDNWDAIDSWWAHKQEKSPEELAVEEAEKKRKRIDANIIYIKRNYFSDKEKQQKELKKRFAELDKWEFDYAEIIDKLKAETE